MKRWIHAATPVITKEDIKDAFETQWVLEIVTPDMIAYPDDSDQFFVIDLNKATDFANSSEGAKYIDEMGGIFAGLLEAAWDDKDSGVTTYNFEDNRFEIARTFEDAGYKVPDYVYF